MRSRFAPAKVNLFLHVTGKRADGYHALDSLAVFPAVGDVVGAEPAADLSLKISGRFGAVLQAESDNLLLRAARALCPGAGVALSLEKNLPVASGIGGGSADAAAALRLLAELWETEAPLHEIALGLGADVPVCLDSAPARMGGVRRDFAPGTPSAQLRHGARKSRRRGANAFGVSRQAGSIFRPGGIAGSLGGCQRDGAGPRTHHQ